MYLIKHEFHFTSPGCTYNFQNFSKQGVTEGTEIKNLTNSDVISVSKKITTLEMKELNERQRAEHAVRMYEQQKSILHDLETRNKDLEEKFAEVRKGVVERVWLFFGGVG